MPAGGIRFLVRSSWTSQKRAFLRAALSYLFFGLGPFRGTHRPCAGHVVPRDFVGVCVATSANAEDDRYVVDRLRELAIDRVRVDYGYDSPANHAGRLLNLLLDASFDVLLHLVQPKETAAAMEQAGPQQAWRDFVGRTLQRYGSRLAGVEIGSTVNRPRWAGYTLEGFTHAWNIACDEARRLGVKIAGPNVTDFEPLYAAGLLHLMRQNGRLPDVYTNNLFVERVIEPEAFDHRVAGRLWADLLGLNLIKKARQMRQIARRHGVEQYWNGYVSWTFPRIVRRLPNVAEKQADYLTRYLVLAAAAGAMDRVYWGPLISRREGLIDDPNNPNPREELVTCYQTVYGPAASFRPRPAFRALRQFAAAVPGCRYRGRLVSADGLEVHAFEANERLTHVVWTHNGMAARLDDVYRSDDIDAAAWTDLFGAALDERPRLATESPLYLSWTPPRHIAVDAAARPIPGLAINLNNADGRYYPFRTDRWQGVVVARDAAHAETLLAGLLPDRPNGGAVVDVLRRGRNAIWTVPDPAGEDRLLAVKQPINLRVHKRLIERFRRTKAIRSFSGACELLRRGIASPRPVAYIERRHGPGLTENFYVCEYEPGRLSVRRFFSAYAAGEERFDGLRLDEFLASLVPFLVDLHNRGVYFRDLSGGNVLVARTGDGELAFSLIDTARAHFSNDAVSIHQRLADLKRICYKLHWEGRALLMERYLAAIGRSFTLPYRIPFVLYDLKAGAKRRARRG
jgi:hypothetical protein